MKSGANKEKNMISTILTLLSAVVSLYTVLCFIDIIMSWIPGIKFTAFGRFISSLCDPYMFFFSKHGWLRFGNIDFSPIISIGILSLISSILSRITTTGRIYIGGILASIFSMFWSIISSLASLFALLIFIRWIVLVIKKGQTSYNSSWYQLDVLLTKVTERISKTFSKGNIVYQKQLLISWIALVVILIAGNVLTNIICSLCYALPF